MIKVVVFDLDDTLYKEIDFLKSAFKEIVHYAVGQVNGSHLNPAALYEGMLDTYFSKIDAFDYIISSLGVNLDKSILLSLYRNHVPNISLSEGAFELLTDIKGQGSEIGIITDGRSIQQRNKIKALGLDRFVSEENLIISEEFGSEKPSSSNYEYFMKRFPFADEYIYIGDNLKKDFIAPNSLGWKTICLLDDDRNIHKQDFSLAPEYLPHYTVYALSEIMDEKI